MEAIGSIILGPLVKGGLILLALFVAYRIILKKGKVEQKLKDKEATEKKQKKVNKVKKTSSKELDDVLDKGEF